MQKAMDWRFNIGVWFGRSLRFIIMAALLPIVAVWKILLAILFGERTDLAFSNYLRMMVARRPR